jgi:hypothetical protein
MINKLVGITAKSQKAALKREFFNEEVLTGADDYRPRSVTALFPLKLAINEEIAMCGLIFVFEGRERGKALISIHKDEYSEEKYPDFKVENNPQKFEVGIEQAIHSPAGKMRFVVNSASDWRAECGLAML